MAFTSPYGELLPHGGERSTGGITRLPRQFFIKGNTPKQALEDPDLLIEAPLGGQHPETSSGDALFASQYRVGERAGAGSDVGYFVEVEYVPGDVNFDFPPPDKSDPAYTAFGYSTQTLDISIPIISRFEVVVFYVEPNPLPGRYDYNPRVDRTIGVPGAELRAEVNLSSFNENDANTIRLQHDTIHTFGSPAADWRFIGGTADNLYRPDQWHVTYRWLGDPGTPTEALDPAIYGGKALSDPGWKAFTPAHIANIPPRPPHAIWEVRTADPVFGPPAPGDPYEQYPQIVAVVPYKANPNGHLTLPGANLIFV